MTGAELGCVGVPAICPVEGSRFRPAGKGVLGVDQLYAPVPPKAVSLASYACWTTPLGKAVVVIVMLHWVN